MQIALPSRDAWCIMLIMMRTHSQIIDHRDAPRLANALGVSVHTVRSWKQRGSIPAEYWRGFDAAGVATIEELAASAKPRKRAQQDAAA